jgi:hypothetical protein
VVIPQKGCVRLLVCLTIDAPLLLLLLYEPLPCLLRKGGIAIGPIGHKDIFLATVVVMQDIVTAAISGCLDRRILCNITTCSLVSLLSRSACKRRKNSLLPVVGRLLCVLEVAEADVEGRRAKSCARSQ